MTASCLKCGRWFDAGRAGEATYCPTCMDETEQRRRWWETTTPTETPADQHLRAVGAPTLFSLGD